MRAFFIAAVLGFAALVAGAVEPLDSLSGSDRERALLAEELIVLARNKIWTGVTNPQNMESVLNRAAGHAGLIGDVAARDYLLARVELNRIRLAITMEAGKKVFLPFAEKAIELAESSVKARESSDGFRVLAILSSIWMVNKGLFATIGKAGEVYDWSERAMELDPQNARAELVYIQILIQAPGSFGGQPEKARMRLLHLHSRSDLTDIDRFWVRKSLSDAYAKLKDREEGRRWCLSAEEIFPYNPLVKECRKELKIRD